jgi:hypothetical protein
MDFHSHVLSRRQQAARSAGIGRQKEISMHRPGIRLPALAGALAAALLCAGRLGGAEPARLPQRSMLEAQWIAEDQKAAGTSGQAFSLAHTRRVLERAGALARRLEPAAGAASLAPLVDELRQLALRLQAMEKGGEPSVAQRRALYIQARDITRRIAFANPLLNIDRLLFIKRHPPRGEFHMCDQYYGFNAVPGGGLFVLEAPFSDSPRVRNLLEDSVVQQGRLAGRGLEGGSFLSPNVSYDGRTILFAWSEAQGSNLEWSPRASYHIFRVEADGAGLVQLTDGSWNDFDPVFLPGGRIAFISERRGGFLRCGRHCPVYTLFGMDADGDDIICLSFHETHEWHPSVNNDGMIVYTRWDYIDRDTNVAHHIWTCYPDGRDPRSFHGNYPDRRESRPWMEMSIRAIPGSAKYVATAAAHHGHAFGSLVIIDPQVRDDGAMSQLERLTPEVPFPEAETDLKSIRPAQQFATPWPLGEDDFLCAYSADAKNHGIWWIDRFGNRELIYRDGEIACLSPMPLGPRPQPPVIPAQTVQARADIERAGGTVPPATVAVMNVYDSEFEWPASLQVKSLRVIQVLPKTTAPPNVPRIGVAEQTNARAVLGTVPVETDGSAHFVAPAGRQIYFQALDERGMAIQSMRSGTYLHPGERLTCQGCHESKHDAPRSLSPPLALQREPSAIVPEVEGSNPFSYVRLVQPVLDRHCVDCHQENKAVDLRGIVEGKHGWTRSYTSLAGKYGFYYHVTNGAIRSPQHGGSRTPAGRFGARASKLLPYLDERHHGVKLTAEELRRVTLWLDCNSEFFGSYENTEAQSKGQVVWPTMD